ARKLATQHALVTTLETTLRLLHPFMPFITEEIWQKLGDAEQSIMVAPYPVFSEELDDTDAARLIDTMRGIITRIRNLRAEKGFTPKDRFKLYISYDVERDARFFSEYAYLLMELARLSEVHVNEQPPAGAFQDAVNGVAIAVELPEKVVTPEELEKTRRELQKSRQELEGVEARLANGQFVNNAPPNVVAGAQARRAELVARIAELEKNEAVSS
ncbi:MAG TPA: class I tRNA ligase family protein, partial [Thermoanaerobaculia bacterium]|nr:class I tRNA ligase family protein [Thermoanaerobaculia bacterium]